MNYGVSIMEMTKYFQQHQDVLSLLKDIESKIRSPDAMPIELADSLINFSVRLKHHLAMEDMFLYPKAIGSVNSDFKQLASKMHEEMVPISKQFVAYIECWGPKQIEKDSRPLYQRYQRYLRRPAHTHCRRGSQFLSHGREIAVIFGEYEGDYNFVTNLAIIFLRPIWSNSISKPIDAPLPSTFITLPSPKLEWETRSPRW